MNWEKELEGERKEKKMEGNKNEEVFVAEGREEHVQFEKSYVTEKKHLKVASLMGEIVIKSDDPANPAIEELEANDAVKSNQKIVASSEGESICPFLQIGFTNSNGGHLQITLKGKEDGPDEKGNTSCLNNIVFAKQEIVSRSLISNKLVAARYHKQSSMRYPDPVPLSSSMASFKNGKWNKFGIQKQVLPSGLIEDCFRSVVRTGNWIEKSGPGVSNQDPRIIKPDYMETIGIICGERFDFKNQEDFNTHVQERHGGVNIFDIPLAVPTDTVDEERETKKVVTKCKWLEVHEFDSTEEVISKLTTAVRVQLNNKATGGVKDKSELSGKDVIGILNQIFVENDQWVRMTAMSAAAESNDVSLLDLEALTKVKFIDVKQWVFAMWNRRPKESFTKRISELTRCTIPDSDQLILQFMAALDEVKAATGSRNEILLPVRLEDTQSTTPAMVDFRLFLATLKVLELWTTENKRFWNILNSEGVDSILFPTSFRDKPLGPTSIIKGLQTIEKRIRQGALDHRITQDHRITKKNQKPKLAKTGTRFIKKFISGCLRDKGIKGFDALITSDQVENILTTNTNFLSKDKETNECGRKRCASKIKCHKYREEQNNNGHALYILMACRSFAKVAKEEAYLESKTMKIQAEVRGKKQKNSGKKGPRKTITSINQVNMITITSAEVNSKKVEDPRNPEEQGDVKNSVATIQEEAAEIEEIQRKDDNGSNVDKVNIILVSTRGSNEPNPLKKLYKDNQPPTKQELENYLHIHPAIEEVEEVQEILQVHYSKYDSEDESSSDEEIVIQQPRMQEHLDYLQDLPAKEKKRVKAEIAKAKKEMSQKVIQEYSHIDPIILERIKGHGAEMHDNLFISDHKYFYTDEDMFTQRIYKTGRRDLDWFLSPDTVLTTEEKLSQLITITRYVGHGTSLGDLKEATGKPRKTPCSDELINELCNCPESAVYDIGRGRGNPENICIGHSCWGIATSVPLNELQDGVLQNWIDNYGCDLKENCPMGFCIHVIGTPGLDVENMQMTISRINNLNRRNDLDILLEDIKEAPPTDHMVQTSHLQSWRCTLGFSENRRHVEVIDTISTIQDCHVFWKACNQLEKAERMSLTQNNIDYMPTVPHTHSGTPPQATPQHISGDVTSFNELSFEEKTPHIMVIQPNQSQQTKTPDISSNRSILRKEKPKRPPPPVFLLTKPKPSVHFETPHKKETIPSVKDLRRLKHSKPVKNQQKITPVCKMVLISTLIFILICGAAVTGGILSYRDHNEHWHQKVNSEFTLPILKRLSRESGINSEVRDEFDKITTTEQKGSAPYRIFSDQVISLAVHQEVSNWNLKMENSIDNLLKSQINPAICENHEWEQKEEQKICSNTIVNTNRIIRATLNVVETSFWNLNSICSTNINPAIFSSIRDKTEGFEELYPIEYKKRNNDRTKPPTTETTTIRITSMFKSGKAIVAALQGEGNQTWVTLNEQPSEEATNTQNQVNKTRISLGIIDFWYTKASLYAKTAALQAQEINTEYNNLIFGNQDGSEDMKKEISEAVKEVEEKLISTAPNTADRESIRKIVRQSCSIETSISSSRRNKQIRSRCEELTISRKAVCIIPDRIIKSEDIKHHPAISNAFYINNQPQQVDWVIYSNPHQSTQFATNLEAINMGRKIKARGNTTLSFLPSKQVLSDQIVFHTVNKAKLWNVLIRCSMHNGTKEEMGYMAIRNNEAITVGYNCKLEHHFLSVPQVTKGLVQSAYKEGKNSGWNGQHQFSISAMNSSGYQVIGFNNDRISKVRAYWPNNRVYWRNEITSEWSWSGKNWPTITIYSVLIITLVIWTISTVYTTVTKNVRWTRNPPYVAFGKDVTAT